MRSVLVIGGNNTIDFTLYDKDVIIKCISSCHVLILTEEYFHEIYKLIDTSGHVLTADNTEATKSLSKIIGTPLLVVLSLTGNIYISSLKDNIIHSNNINIPPNAFQYTTILAPIVASLTVALYKHGFPTSQQQLDKLSSIIKTVSTVVIQSDAGISDNNDYVIPNDKVLNKLTAKLGSIMFPGSACPLTGQINPKNFEHMLTFIDSLRHDACICEKLPNILVGDNYRDFLDIIINCQGHIITSGIGKSGLVASRMSSSLMSTGIIIITLY